MTIHPLVAQLVDYTLWANTRFVDRLQQEPDELLDAAMAEAELILANSPFGIRMTKEVMWSQLEVGSMAAGIDLENRTQVVSSATDAMAEAITAFLEKRPPDFG